MADPKIKYDIEANVKGDAEVGQLAGKLEALAQTLDGDLKANANAAAAALRQLGDKQTAIARFVELKQVAQDAAARLNEAQLAAQKMGQTLAATEAPTRTQAGQMQKLGEAVRAAKAEVLQQSAAVIDARAVLQQYGVNTRNLAQSQQGVKAAVAATKLEINALTQQHIVATKATAEQVDADRALAAEEARLAGIVEASRNRMANAARAEAEGVLRDSARVEEANKKAAAAAANAATAATSTAQRIQSAFSTVGVKSATELRAEIERIRRAMETIRTGSGETGAALRGAFSAGNAKIKELQADLRQVEGNMTLADKARGLFSSGMAQFAGGNLIGNGISFLVAKIAAIGPAFVSANVELESTRRALGAVYKSSATTASQLSFLRRTADEAGVSAGGLSSSFVRFAASTKSAGISLETTNALFASVTKAGATLGLSTERVSLVLQALGQMASKGVVSMEELRQQLGESLPGALTLAAQGLGLTEMQLIKLVESGKLAARDLFPALAQSLKSLEGDTNTTASSWERFKNVIDLSLTSAGDAGGMAVLTLGLRSLAAVLGAIVVPIATFVELLFGAVKAVGVLAGAVVTLTNPTQALSEIFSVAAGRLGALSDAFRSAAGLAEIHAKSQEAVAQATQASGQASAVTAVQIATATAAAQANAAATDGVALAHKIMGDGAMQLGAKWVQLGVKLGEVVDAQSKQVSVSEKVAAANKIEGDSLVALTRLRGNDLDNLQAEVAASQANVIALGAVAAARERGLSSMRAELDQKLVLIAGNVEEAKARALAITELRQKVTAMEAETLASRNAAEAAKNEAVARRVALDTYKDNALAVAASRIAMEKAKEVEADYIRLAKEGAISMEAATEATRRRTRAEALYKDALSDSIKLESVRASVVQSVLQLQQAGLSLLTAQAEAAKQKAIRDGDEYAFAQAVIKQKEIEIKLIELRVSSLASEAAGIIAVANATKVELEAKGKLTEVQKLQIENSIRAAEIKLKEAEAMGQGVAELKKQLEELRSGNAIQKEWNSLKEKGTAASVSQAAALGRETGATRDNSEAKKVQAEAYDRMLMRYKQSSEYSESQIALLEKENALVERRIELENKRLNRDKEGFSLNTGGKRVNMAVETQASTYKNAKSQGLTDAQALKIAAEFISERGEQIGWQRGGNQGQSWSLQVQKAIDEMVLKNAAEAASAPPKSDAASAVAAPAPLAPASTRPLASAPTMPAVAPPVINITLEAGNTKTLRFFDQSSQTATADIIKQLAMAASTAGRR